MANYTDVLIPLPLNTLFTYKLTDAEAAYLKQGMRVSVPFGKRKLYTGIVISVHTNAPINYETKPIDCVIDDAPMVTVQQLKLMDWVSKYYMSNFGDVLRAAMPSSLLLQGEMIISRTAKDYTDSEINDREFLILDALNYQTALKVSEVVKLLNKKKVLPDLNSLLSKQLIKIEEVLKEKYVPKKEKYVRLLLESIEESKIEQILQELSNAPKQKEVFLQCLVQKSKFQVNEIKLKTLLSQAKATSASVKGLGNKGYIEVFEKQVDRISFSGDVPLEQLVLTTQQQKALQEVKSAFQIKNTCLLHGVTSSGKTAVYAKLIFEQLEQNKQVLFLVPELALSANLIERLQGYFGDYLVVYHSRYSNHERVEAYKKILNNVNRPQLILGLKSSVYLPFNNLSLVIIDEEHDSSYRQFDPSPRIHGRDVAILLGNQFSAKVLLGSATPSVDSYANAQQGKYGLVTLKKRYGGVQLPEIELVDLQKAYRQKRMTYHFSDRMIELIQETLDQKKQVIIFQNKRGFANYQNCESCGDIPKCVQCDVSLTYHKYKKQLRCHYCGYNIAQPISCVKCGSSELTVKGVGTEQVEQEFKEIFKGVSVVRMDQDTTRGKYGHQKIMADFESKEARVLIGTQMLAKGLDFSNVGLVAVINADSLLFYPDYRAHEKTFSLLCQVAGRAGRNKDRGKVVVQTFSPDHQIFQQVSLYRYEEMYEDQMRERKQYKYPPFVRLLRLEVKHRNQEVVNQAATWLAQSLRNVFVDNEVLGPEFPAVSRIRNQYQKYILVKLLNDRNLKTKKDVISKIITSFGAIKHFSLVNVDISVDI